MPANAATGCAPTIAARRPVQFSANGFSAHECGAIEFGATELGPAGFSAVEFSAAESNAAESGATELGVAESGAAEFSAAEFGASEPRPSGSVFLGQKSKPARNRQRLLLLMAALPMALLSQEKKEAEYESPDSCGGCHDELITAFAKNRHAKVKTSCDDCHEGARKHSESVDPADVKNPSKLAGLAADKTCLACHRNQSTHAGRIRGGHARSDVTCTNCHSVHSAAKKPNDCGQCHTATVSEFQRPYKHGLASGAIRCTDCHNPHGRTLANHQAAASANEPGCINCHGNLRGPFVFEHAPVRQEGCNACHEPHGSANPRMLNRAQVHLQCLECHSNTSTNPSVAGGTPPAFHNLRDPRIRNCTTCHVKIHGSHVNRALLR